MKKNIFIYILVAALMLLGALPSYGQNKPTVSGFVYDSGSVAIWGATVSVQGQTKGVITDENGAFTLEVDPGKDLVIEVQCLGYTSVTQGCKPGTTNLRFVLEESTEALDEAVVVGYGTVRKSDMTGSVSSVKIDKVAASQVTSFDRLLQGSAAGVQVTTGSNAPGGAVNIKIRGTSSFNGSGEPLYVVDGIILNPASQDVSNPISSSGQEAQNALTSINPNEDRKSVV